MSEEQNTVVLDLTKTDEQQSDLPAMEGPGVASPAIPEIDKAAAAYAKIRDRRVALTAEEVSAKDKLITLLHAHQEEIGRAPDGSIKYRSEDFKIELFPAKEKLKVKSLDSFYGEEEEGEE